LATFGAVIVVAGVFDRVRQGRVGWLRRLRTTRVRDGSPVAADAP